MSSLRTHAREAGDAYFMALRGLGADIDIVFTCDLQQPLAAEQAVAAFERLVEQHGLLRSRRTLDATDPSVWRWERDEGDAWRAPWAQVRAALLSGRTDAPPGLADVLPFRLGAVSPGQLVFRVDHTFANGRSGFGWIERYFAVLSGSQPEAPTVQGRVLGPAGSAWQAVRAAWTGGLVRRAAGRRELREPYLLRGPSGDWRSDVRRWQMSAAELRRSLQEGLQGSTTECLVQRLAAHLQALHPEAGTVPLQVVADLHAACGVPLGEPGNFTAVMTGYFSRSDALPKQVSLFFKRLRQGAGAGQAALVRASGARHLREMRDWFTRRLSPALRGGRPAAFMDPLVTVSNVGELQGAFSRQWLRAASLRTSTPSAYLSLTTVGDCATVELCTPAHVFDAPRVAAVIEALLQPAAPRAEAAPAQVTMPAMLPRKFLYDGTQFPLQWNGGNAYISQAFNAISLLFPVGEKWIIDTVRRTIDTLPPTARPAWNACARDFIAQESLHRAVHRRYNECLQAHGLPDWIDGRGRRRTAWGERGRPINQLASSVAYEHLTAVFAAGLLRNPQWLSSADPSLAALWHWHACEELEHKHFVFDLYRAAGGGSVRRILWYVWALNTFMLDVHYQLLLNLKASGALWRPRTLLEGLAFNFGRRGLFWDLLRSSVAFMRPGFRPAQRSVDSLARDWLSSNAARFQPQPGATIP